MKIAIASEGKTIDSKVCPTAGRAPYYLIFEDKKLIKTIKNPFAVGGGGAGFGVIQMLSNENINLIVSGKFGENMIIALKEKNMKYLEITNKTITDVLKDDLNDKNNL